MSESDDTDYLLLIPPNFFLVPSDNESECSPKKGVVVEKELVDELIGQVNDLQNRVSLIESSDSSQIPTVVEGETLSLLSTPYAPSIIALTKTSLEKYKENEIFTWVSNSPFKSNSVGNLSKDVLYLNDNLIDRKVDIFNSELNFQRLDCDKMSSPTKRFDSANHGEINAVPPGHKKLELHEVDRLLKEMEITQRDIENKLKMREQEFGIRGGSPRTNEVQETPHLVGEYIGSIPDLGFGIRNMFADSPRSSPEKRHSDIKDPKPVVEEPCIKTKISMLGSSLEDNNSDKWKTFLSHDICQTPRGGGLKSPERRKPASVRRKLCLNDDEKPNSPDVRSLSHAPDSPFKSVPTHHELVSSNRFRPTDVRATQTVDTQTTQVTGNMRNKDQTQGSMFGSYGNKLLSLNELWKPEDETIYRNPLKLRQKLEEEKYRRTHLEATVQALQKKVLEEQEKVAVAVQVDEKKDIVIEKVTEAWKQMVNHWKQIEDQRHAASQALLAEKVITKKAQEDIEKKIMRWEKEVSQALDLAAGFKTKAESLEREIIKVKSNLEGQLESAEEKAQCAEVIAKNRERELCEVQSRLDQACGDLEEERKLVQESRNEISSLESCVNKLEAELAVVKEQRDLLSMRLKEERARNNNLDQHKSTMDNALAESKRKEREAEEGWEAAKKQLETVKSELRILYQSQLESVVKEKLGEFQGQLETARDDMRRQLDNELTTARESAARHHQSLVNSHVVEMRRLESIHKDEISVLERRLAEAELRCSRLERGKKDVAQKLHAVMESQWQQALSIITNEFSLRQVEPEQDKVRVTHDDQANTTIDSLPASAVDGGTSHLPNQGHLFNYIQMLLEKQPGKPVDSATGSSMLADSTNEQLEDMSAEQQRWNQYAFQGNEHKYLGKKPPWK